MFSKISSGRHCKVAAITALAVTVAVLLSVSACLAGVRWTANGVAICTEAFDQFDPQITSDGNGGAIVTWNDYRSDTDYDIYAQRVLSGGTVDPAWPVDGVAICTEALDQVKPQITSDGSGGAIITWQDYRSGADDDIYAQRVLSGGTVDPAWPADGVAICTEAGLQRNPQITSDGSGGAIITWQDQRSGNWDIYAQRVLSGGTVDPAWPANGVAICTEAGSQSTPQITTDGSGGAIITWWDSRSGNMDIYAQKVLSGGTVDPAWPVNGVAVCTAPDDQIYPEITSDGSGGAIITWWDNRSGTNYDIYAQKVLSGGTVDPAWPANGVAICTEANDQTYPEITSDGSGGAIITWRDYRSGTNWDVYAQKVLSGGTVDPAWPVNGVAICTAANDQWLPQITTDGSGGAIITWRDYRSGTNWDVYAQKVLSGGTVDPAWPANGVAICTAADDQRDPQITSDGSGGAVIPWEDYRSGADNDIYAQRVSNPAPTVTGITPNSGTNDGVVSITDLAGTGFFAPDYGAGPINPTVKLRMTGEADIDATSVNVVSGTRITCDLDLSGAATGAWDVYVQNCDSQNDTLVGGFTVNAPQNTPVVDSVSPPEGPPGTPVTIKGTNFGDTQGTSYVTFNGVQATQYLSWSDTEIVVIVPEGATTGPVEVVTAAGGSNTDHDFTIDAKQLGSNAWIVAEGSTGEGFDTFILMQNPNDAPAPTAVAFSTEDGIQDGTLLEIPANSRVTMRLSDYMPDTWSISTMVASEVPIVVERSMYWNSDQTAYPYEMRSGHANLGLPAPMQPGFKMDASSDRSTDQYFPEGSTAGFDTWILLFNPMETQSQARVTLMDETGPVVEENVTIGPLSRKTVHLNKLLPDANQVATRVESDTFLVAERSMYWDPDAGEKQPYQMIGGHSTSGSPLAANNWYVAEGSTGGGFETYILLQNPSDADAPVTALFSDATGTVAQLDTTMPAQSRSTVKVSDYVPDNFQVSTNITSDREIVAERSMYWDNRETTEPSSMKDGHSCVGETAAASTWMVPEGSTGGGFDTFVLIANTEDTEATAAVTFMTEAGPQAPFNITIPATSRYTLRVSDYLPDSFQVSTLIRGNRELVVERSMYWDNRVMSPDGNFPARPFECIGGHSANGLDP